MIHNFPGNKFPNTYPHLFFIANAIAYIWHPYSICYICRPDSAQPIKFLKCFPEKTTPLIFPDLF